MGWRVYACSMKKTGWFLIAALSIGTLAGCIVRTAPCHTECWWDHGRKVCERRCR